MNVPTARESSIDGASIVGQVLSVLETRGRENNGGEGEVGSVGDLLAQSLGVRRRLAPARRGRKALGRWHTSSESKRMPSTGLSSSSHSEAKTIKLPASSAQVRKNSEDQLPPSRAPGS